MRIYSQQAGFTFIELLLTVAMVLVLGGFSSIYLTRSLYSNATQNTADYIAGTLRKAQAYAMSGKNNSKWGVTITGNQVVFFQGNSYATRVTSQDQTFDLNTNITISGFSEVVFTKDTGTPSATLTVTISASQASKNLTLNNQGVVSY